MEIFLPLSSIPGNKQSAHALLIPDLERHNANYLGDAIGITLIGQILYSATSMSAQQQTAPQAIYSDLKKKA